jgi:hypothetical protein
MFKNFFMLVVGLGLSGCICRSDNMMVAPQPVTVLHMPSAVKLYVLSDHVFIPNTAMVSEEGEGTLKRIARYMPSSRAMVQVVAHTDCHLPVSRQRLLAQQQANRVVQTLTHNMALSPFSKNLTLLYAAGSCQLASRSDPQERFTRYLDVTITRLYHGRA